MTSELELLFAKKKKLLGQTNSLFGFIARGYFLRKSKRLELQLDAAIVSYLRKSNSHIESIVYEIETLLVNERLKFKVTKEGASPFTYMTKRFEGSIHNNGFLYLNAKSNAIEYLNVLGHFYPTQYGGEIDAFGNTSVRVTKTSAALFGKVPSAFIGTIDKLGRMSFRTSESWREIDGNIHVQKIIADPFNGNAEKRARFLALRQELKNALSDWKINHEN